MLVRPIYQEWELWKWLAILSLAAALSLAFASALGAADRRDPDRPPKLLPPETIELATPMPGENSPTGNDDTDLEWVMWEVLDLHRLRDHEAAIAKWSELDLPPESLVWKWIALGQASIAMERYEQANQFLGAAIDARPDNALAYYFRGVLRMQQAALAWDWPEDVGPRNTRLVAFAPLDVVPNNKSMYELAATMDFEKAIELARTCRFDETIVPNRLGTKAALEPTVGDLLIALDAEKFDAKAHNALGKLFLERGALELAERHMDAAVHGGMKVGHGYRDLGAAYRARGQDADATRAFLKEIRINDHKH